MKQPDHCNPNYWFPAKTYGWGWGLPIKWQGWVVIAVFLLLLLGGVLLKQYAADAIIGFATLLSVILFAICWLKGEPTHWRWGGK